MEEKYPVEIIQPEWVFNPEEMGSKKKFWYFDIAGSQWLFKYPQQNTGQHWAEKIAEQVAHILNIDHAKTELAICKGYRGSSALSFASRGVSLYHGNQLLEISIVDYDKSIRFHQSSHTLSNIWKVFDRIFVDEKTSFKIKIQFASYLLLE